MFLSGLVPVSTQPLHITTYLTRLLLVMARPGRTEYQLLMKVSDSHQNVKMLMFWSCKSNKQRAGVRGVTSQKIWTDKLQRVMNAVAPSRGALQSALCHSMTTKFPSVQHDKLWLTSILVRRPSCLKLTARTSATDHSNEPLQALAKNVFIRANIVPRANKTFCSMGYISLLFYLLTRGKYGKVTAY